MIVVTEQGLREMEARRVAALKAARGRETGARGHGRRETAPGEEPPAEAARAQGEDGQGEDGRDAAAGEESRGPLTVAHAAAEGAMGARKASSEAAAGGGGGAWEGPGRPMVPGRASPDQFTRPLIAEGRPAASPGHEPTRHLAQAAAEGLLRPVDLSGSRMAARPVFPQAPLGPQGGRR